MRAIHTPEVFFTTVLPMAHANLLAMTLLARIHGLAIGASSEWVHAPVASLARFAQVTEAQAAAALAWLRDRRLIESRADSHRVAWENCSTGFQPVGGTGLQPVLRKPASGTGLQPAISLAGGRR